MGWIDVVHCTSNDQLKGPGSKPTRGHPNHPLSRSIPLYASNELFMTLRSHPNNPLSENGMLHHGVRGSARTSQREDFVFPVPPLPVKMSRKHQSRCPDSAAAKMQERLDAGIASKME